MEKGDRQESMKKVLGFQVRAPGAPGPLTLKEVEELEQLTQQLMQDMEHPQRQNVAVNGELTPPPHWPTGRGGGGLAPPPAEPRIPCKLLPPVDFRFLWPPQSSVAGVISPWHARSLQFGLWGSCSTSPVLPATSVSSSCRDSSSTAWRGRPTVRVAIL